MRKVQYGAAVAGGRPDSDGMDVSPDWLLVSIIKSIAVQAPRYARIRKYVEGKPPIPDTPNSVKDEWMEFERFREKSRTNFASLVIAACLDKTSIQSFRTAAQDDENGDLEAEKLMEANDFAVKHDRTNFDMFTYGMGFMLADPLSKRAQDFRPWNAGVIRDSFGTPLVGVSMHHNPIERRDYAHLWTRDMDTSGQATGRVSVHIAVRDRENKTYAGKQFDREVPVGSGMHRGWVWWKTIQTDVEDLPLIDFPNRDEVGEFEHHTDVLDRINHMILQRVVIATMQAFRQRAIKGKLPKHDDDGTEIDYDKRFPVSPGSLWLLGPDAEMWESQTTSTQDILAGTKDDVRDLSSVTRTPMSYFSPDGANNSATGASLQDSSYTIKISDRKTRNSGRWRLWMSLMFRINGDTLRAQIDDIEVLWSETETTSITERFAAANSAVAMGISLDTAMREVLQWSPRQIKAAKIEQIAATLTKSLAESPNGQQTPLQASTANKQNAAKTSTPA